MKNFIHLSPTTVSQAVSYLTQYKGNAKIIAGGTDLLGTMKDECNPTYPQAIIDIKTIPNLNKITTDTSGLHLGTLAILDDIAGTSAVSSTWPALAQAAASVASPHIREMGTIGGNLCQDVRCWYYRAPLNFFNCLRKGGPMCYATAGDNRFHSIFGGSKGCYAVYPSDTATALLALNASVVTNSRTIPIDSFFDNLTGTVLASNEIVTQIDIPTPPSGSKQVYLKNRIRKAIDFPIVGVASLITVASGSVSAARIALGAVAPVPMRATAAETALVGKASPVTAANATAAAAAALQNAYPMTKNNYKVSITQALISQAIQS
jgi:xanthine dehydrogenase YagS FAD-binding subunit